MQDLPHKYYDENNLHAFLIEQIKDYDKCIIALDNFLPYVDNWATCDLMKPKVLGKYKNKLILNINQWLKSDLEYTVRYAVEMLMVHFLDADFDITYLDIVANVKSNKYYVQMMQAWYFATALAKHYDETIDILKSNKLDIWVHNKTIQKAIESYRITNEQKVELKKMKR